MSGPNLTSFSVSRELFSLSNWIDHTNRHYWAKEHPQDKPELVNRAVPVWTWWAAYDCGYLLRKIGPHLSLRHVGAEHWVASALQSEGAGSTPEDALGILAIKLLEERKIKPGPVI